MLSRVPPEHRRLLILVGAAAIAAGVFAGAAVILATGQPAVKPGRYEPFAVGNAARLGQIIATEQPLFFADPTGGDRGFVLALDDGDFAALHVVPPGGSRACPINWEPEAARFADCRGTQYQPDQLRRFHTRVNDDGLVVVDLRKVEEPQPTTAATG